MPTQCFFIVSTTRARRYLRRYKSINPNNYANAKLQPNCPLPHGYHDRSTFIDEIEIQIDEQGHWSGSDGDQDLLQFVGDERWPMQCECGYVFQQSDERQIFLDRIYRQSPLTRTDLPEFMTLREAPVGAMWDAHWYPDYWKGPDGRSLICKVPKDHDWHIDGRASNCTMPNDNVHKCWVRHGEPPNITVDKDGNTCQAGGGSIQTAEWHGFLRNGILEP